MEALFRQRVRLPTAWLKINLGRSNTSAETWEPTSQQLQLARLWQHSDCRAIRDDYLIKPKLAVTEQQDEEGQKVVKVGDHLTVRVVMVRLAVRRLPNDPPGLPVTVVCDSYLQPLHHELIDTTLARQGCMVAFLSEKATLDPKWSDAMRGDRGGSVRFGTSVACLPVEGGGTKPLIAPLEYIWVTGLLQQEQEVWSWNDHTTRCRGCSGWRSGEAASPTMSVPPTWRR